METTDVLPAPRQAADERRDAIIDAAIVKFAVSGLHGTPTETIARRAGISQPSIFRPFGSKQESFLAALERVSDRTAPTILAAAGVTEGGVLEAMGHAYATVLAGRDELFLLPQAFAASSDRGCVRSPRHRVLARRGYASSSRTRGRRGDRPAAPRRHGRGGFRITFFVTGS